MDIFLEHLKEMTGNSLGENQVRMMNPLILAYIGDTIYDLLVRTYLIMTKDVTVHNLHKQAIDFVSAGAQAHTLDNILDKLTDEEKNIIRRGRNAKSGTVPKNAHIGEYKYATGFEALLGYLYLLGRTDRLIEIGDLILKQHNAS
ncbi:MAG TPA: ribonuclease III domain-containing protein [Clostridia bacterium]|nr:ribonuclease III domain-containing protein [Clostridia bacterium]